MTAILRPLGARVTSPINADRQKVRQTFIGASEIKTIIEGTPQDVENLRLQKLGRLEPEDLSRNVRVKMGLAMEAVTLDCYELETGRRLISEDTLIRHPRLSFLACTLDAFDPEIQHVTAQGDVLTGATVQAKFHSGTKSITTLLDDYIWQVETEAFVCGTGLHVLAVTFGTGDFRYLVSEADPNAQWEIERAAETFWRHVENDVPWPGGEKVERPKPKIVAPRIYDDLRMIQGGNRLPELLDRYTRLKDGEAELKTVRDEIKDALPADMSVGYLPGYELKRTKAGALIICVTARE